MKDLDRTAPDNAEFESDISIGKNRLYNVLRAYANLDPEIGYCQGMNFIAAMLLLNI
jgi:ecotropic viral integration site 5 protein